MLQEFFFQFCFSLDWALLCKTFMPTCTLSHTKKNVAKKECHRKQLFFSKIACVYSLDKKNVENKRMYIQKRKIMFVRRHSLFYGPLTSQNIEWPANIKPNKRDTFMRIAKKKSFILFDFFSSSFEDDDVAHFCNGNTMRFLSRMDILLVLPLPR